MIFDSVDFLWMKISCTYSILSLKDSQEKNRISLTCSQFLCVLLSNSDKKKKSNAITIQCSF